MKHTVDEEIFTEVIQETFPDSFHTIFHILNNLDRKYINQILNDELYDIWFDIYNEIFFITTIELDSDVKTRYLIWFDGIRSQIYFSEYYDYAYLFNEIKHEFNTDLNDLGYLISNLRI